MSTSRLMVVFSPVKTKFKNFSFVLKCLFHIYTSVLFFTFCVTLTIKYTVPMLPFKLCFPFIDPTNSVTILHNITWLICLSQFVCLLILGIQNTLLIKVFQHSKQKTNQLISDATLKRTLVITLSMGTVSVALSWIPTSIIYVTLLIIPKYPINLVLWTVLIMPPITSVIYPTVYITLNIRKLMGSNRIGNALQVF